MTETLEQANAMLDLRRALDLWWAKLGTKPGAWAYQEAKDKTLDQLAGIFAAAWQRVKEAQAPPPTPPPSEATPI